MQYPHVLQEAIDVAESRWGKPRLQRATVLDSTARDRAIRRLLMRAELLHSPNEKFWLKGHAIPAVRDGRLELLHPITFIRDPEKAEWALLKAREKGLPF